MPVVAAAAAPWVLAALGFAIVSQEKKPGAPATPGAPGVPPGIPGTEPTFPGGVTDQPVTPGALSLLTEIRQLPDGTLVRYFSAQARSIVLQDLSGRALAPVPSNIATVAIFQTIPAGTPLPLPPPGQPPQQAVNARVAVEQISAAGRSVLGTLGLGVPQNPGGFVAFTTAVDRKLAHLSSGWAILFDGAGVAAGVPVTVPGPQPAVPPLPQQPGAPPPPFTPPGVQPPITPTLPPPGIVPPPPPGGAQLDPNMPPEVRAQVEKMLADPEADPFALEEAAAALAPRFPLAAAALRARAAELKDRERLACIQRGSSDFLVRFGDLPSRMAQYYTGDGSRFREIPPLNPGMQTVTKPSPITGQPTTFLQPFNPGQTVKLPCSWKTWEKPLPPVATGVPKAVAPAPTAPAPSPGFVLTTAQQQAQVEAAKQRLLEISRKGGTLTPAQLTQLKALNAETVRLSQLAAQQAARAAAERELGGGPGTTPAERIAAAAAAEAKKRGLVVPPPPPGPILGPEALASIRDARFPRI
jgi:hypothetical protein